MIESDRYKKAVIYYLSGTGNSYRLSKLLADTTEEKGIHTIISPVNDASALVEIEDGRKCIFGLVFPTHGFTAPWYVIKFVCRLPRVKNTHAYCIATRAGLRFGKVFTPGISSSATFLIALILALKGYRLQGVNSIDMPSNWFSLHPIQKEKSISLIINRAQKKTHDFIFCILEGRKNWFTLNNLYEAIWTILLAPVSVGYIFFGRFFFAKLFFANQDCDGCGTCFKNCPIQAIEMKGEENALPFWKYSCESCMRCTAFCPKNAIEAGHSWGVILWMVTTVPISIYLIDWVNEYVSFFSGLNYIWVQKALDCAYFYLSLSVSYLFFQKTIKFKPIKLLFTWTTFTHLKAWGRYREPNTKLKHLQRRKR